MTRDKACLAMGGEKCRCPCHRAHGVAVRLHRIFGVIQRILTVVTVPYA